MTFKTFEGLLPSELKKIERTANMILDRKDLYLKETNTLIIFADIDFVYMKATIFYDGYNYINIYFLVNLYDRRKSHVTEYETGVTQ